MVTPISLPTNQSLPAQVFHRIKELAQKVVDFVCRIFSAIANMPSIAKHYAVFQTVEWVIPPFLKAAANSCYCYVRDFFSSWTHQSLESEIKTLTAQKKQLEEKFESALKKIDMLIESRDRLIDIGKLDQTIQLAQNTELSALRKQLSSALEGITLANQRAIYTRAEADSLRREIKIGEEFLAAASFLNLSDSSSFSSADLSRLSKYGINLGGSPCPLTPAIPT